MYKCAVRCKLYKRQEIFASKLFLTSTKRRAALPLIIHCHRHQRKKIAQKNANCAARKYFEIIELLSRVFRSRLVNNEIVDRIKDGRLKNCRKNEIAAARPNYLVEYEGCRFQELSQLRKLSQLSQVCQKANWTRL